MAQQVDTAEGTRRRMRPETNAWLMLLSFFVLFCLIVAGTSYAGWRYYSGATLPIEDLPKPGLVRVHTNGGVAVQPKGRTEQLYPRETCADNPRGVHDICFQLEEGYRVSTAPGVGYGPVASIVLPDYTQIDLQAPHPSGTDITLEKYQVTRWNNQRQEVVFQQHAGYARYDVTQGQPYTDVSYTVEISGSVRVLLAPGGSYSINVPSGDPLMVTKDGEPILLQVAARRGHAEIQGPNQRTTIGPGQLVQVNQVAVLSAPLLAHWELIRDGDFANHSSEEYNGDNGGTDTWRVAAPSKTPPGESKGAFIITSGCHPRMPDLCPLPAERTTIGQFRREGGQKAQYITPIIQSLKLDVSEYRQLKFSAWTRVLTQTVDGAGIYGTECPIMITFFYQRTSPSDQTDQLTTCVYTGAEASVKQDYIKYFRIPRFEWNHLVIELRAIPELKSVRYLQQIIIEARGHDYLAEMTDISLVGSE